MLDVDGLAIDVKPSRGVGPHLILGKLENLAQSVPKYCAFFVAGTDLATFSTFDIALSEGCRPKAPLGISLSIASMVWSIARSYLITSARCWKTSCESTASIAAVGRTMSPQLMVLLRAAT